MKRLSIAGVVVGMSVTLVAGCSESGSTLRDAAAPPSFYDVNDVAFLLPLPATEAGIDEFPSLHGPGGDFPYASAADLATLINSDDDFEQQNELLGEFTDQEGAAAGDNGESTDPETLLAAIDSWKIVAVRLDPCVKDDPAAATCSRFEFRLVAQPVSLVGSEFDIEADVVGTQDDAIHLVYTVPESLRTQALTDLAALKAIAGTRTDGIALGVHPILREDGLGSPYGKKLLAMVAAYARAGSLRTATSMHVPAVDWFFQKFDVVGGVLTPAILPHVGQKLQIFMAPHEGESMEVPSKQAGDVMPASTAADNANLVNRTVHLRAAPAATMQAAVDMALRIDNPLKHDSATVDCVSCHTASRALQRLKGPDFLNAADGNPNRFVPDARLAGKLVGIVDSGVHRLHSVRAFGYFFEQPSITRGALNDTLKVAAGLNGQAQ